MRSDDSISEAAKRSQSPLLDVSVQETGDKTISAFGSFALIINNLTGPAMLGFPHLFHEAGIIPVVVCTLIVYCCASLCGTLLADSIVRMRISSEAYRHN
jgi:amino acid permease